jgi:nucleotide-binding universal stress UspA family protein
MMTVDLSSLKTIVHPTDLRPESESAFIHALGLAVISTARLVLVHVKPSSSPRKERRTLPGVRATLERWGLLPNGSQRSDVGDRLGVGVKRITIEAEHPSSAIEQVLRTEPASLMVLGTEGRSGLPQWLRPSVAEQVARGGRIPTLFVPTTAKGFVDAETGRISLQRILAPIDASPEPTPALDTAIRVGELLGDDRVDVSLIHVGDGSRMPSLTLPESEIIRWQQLQCAGDVVGEISSAARQGRADLVVMATAGRRGLVDVLRGSVTEQVLRAVDCPLLAVPSV